MADSARRALNYLPSKKLLSITAALSLVGGGLWLLQKPPQKEATGTLSIETVPQNTDASDLKNTSQVSNIGGGAEPLPLQKTIGSPALTGRLLQDIASLYQAGGTMDDQTKQALVQEVAENTKNFFSKNLNIYTDTNLVVDNAVSPHKYLNQLSGIVKKYFSDDPKSPGYENEVLVIYKIAGADKNDLNALKDELQKYIYRYRSAAEELAKINPPQEAAKVHLDFINSFWNTAVALTAISNYRDDPIAGALGMSQYEAEAAATATLLKNAKAIATAYNIVFTKDDPGYFLQLYFEKIKS